MRLFPALAFLTIVIGILGVLHFYIWVRLVRDAALPHPWYKLATTILIFLGLTIPLSFVFARRIPFPIRTYLLYIPYTWLGILLILIALLVLFEIFWVLYQAGRFMTGDEMFDPERRVFLFRMMGGFIGGTAAIEGATAMLIARRNPMVNRVEVKLDKLPAALDGFSIVQLTDLHIGLTVGREWVKEIVGQVNELKADLIAVTGDLVDGFPEHIRHWVEPLGDLVSQNGTFFVTGNHEYYSGVQQWIPEIESLGIRVLRNERVSVGRGTATLDLIGVDDFSSRGLAPGHGPDLPRALKGRDPNRETVLLAHQPRAVFEAARFDIGLVLAGHTHGGQIWPWKYLVYLQQPYISGLHRHGPRTQIYVSQGTGYWGPPMRLGTHGEIAQIILRKK